VYPEPTLLIRWDRAKSHKNVMVCDDLSQHPHIQTFYFPIYSPQLNPNEHVWKLTRDGGNPNHDLRFTALR
jgi:transposase